MIEDRDAKDLGCRPTHEGLLALADKLDAEKSAVGKLVEPLYQQACLRKANDDRKGAAEVYDQIAAVYLAAGFVGAADGFAGLARECRKRRRKKKAVR